MVTFEATFSFKMFIFNFYKNLFDNCNNFEQSRLKRIFSLKLLWGRECNFELLHKMLELFTVFLIVILPSLFVVSLFPRQKLCVFVYAVPSQLVKIANWLSFLNAFCLVVAWKYFSILVFSLRCKRSSTGVIWLQALISLYQAEEWLFLLVTFPIAVMSVFKEKLYMQHLCTLFSFLLTVLSILSLTAFPHISIGSQINAASSSYKRLTSKRSFY